LSDLSGGLVGSSRGVVARRARSQARSDSILRHLSAGGGFCGSAVCF